MLYVTVVVAGLTGLSLAVTVKDLATLVQAARLDPLGTVPTQVSMPTPWSVTGISAS